MNPNAFSASPVKQSQTGFSLLEVSVAMMVVALFVLAAFPGLSTWLARM